MFVAVDHRSAECAGIHAAARATRFEALEPIRQGVRRYFGAFAKDVARGLSVRHDHGSQYMSDHFQKELAFPGACRKLWHGPHDGLYRSQFYALLTAGSPKQTDSIRFCSHTVQAPAKPKPLRSHSMASKPRIVRRAVRKN